MTSRSLLQPRSWQLKTLRALAIGVAVSLVSPAFADNLPDIQKLIWQGQYAQAMDKVDAYLVSRPKDAQGRFLKGLIYTEMNKPNEAIAVFTKLTQDYPELPEPYNNLAVLYAQQKQYDKARASLEMAIRTHPSYAIAYENLGDVYAKLASQAYDKALQLDNSNATTQNKLSLIRDLISATTPGGKATAPAQQQAAATGKPATGKNASANVVATTPGAAASKTEAKPAAPVVAAAPAAPAAAPAPVAAAPAPVAAAPAAPVASPSNDEISQAIAAWAAAWSRKDVDSYLAAYGPEFVPPRGLSREAWELEREQRIAGKPGNIAVTYDAPQISVNGDRATAKFRQYYKAQGLNDTTTKTLVFVRNGGKWLIKEENAR